MSGRSLCDITLGEIHMFTLAPLDKLCVTQRVFSKMLRKEDNLRKKRFFLATKRIESTSTTGKWIEDPRTNRTNALPADNKDITQIADEVPSDADIESIFSEQDDVNLYTTFMIQDSDDSSASSKFSDFSEPNLPSKAYQVTNKSDLSLSPQIQVQILVEKYSKPIPVIAYFDTGVHSTMMNLRVPPPDAWKKKDNEFLATDGQAMVFPLQALYGLVHDLTSYNANLRNFLQWFNPLPVWDNELTKLMGQYHLWKMVTEMAAKVSCIWIFHRPYHYNPHTKLLWASNISYEWDTSYDYEKLYPLCSKIPLFNFLCDVNGDTTDVHFILPGVPRDPSRN
ncbi:hypothetical protein Ddye_017533 [Dipteronia dyeriana]|uniref:Uncharacterized protein n=1 Tax=Dipteronia dyeriana TaxID=168575 RepID=A0AAD9U9R4_9ROSI|nr:hypothetical protein Ddye_017533 [Dipteronia dyeriana]